MGTDAIDTVEVRQQQLRRELADRFAAVGMVTAGVVHDLNNPLAVVLQSLAAAARALQRNDLPMVTAALAAADERAQTMATLIGFLKSALHPREPKPVELADVLAAAIGLAGPQIRACARLVSDVPPGLRVAADESRLVQVFLRVLVNATQSIGENNRAAGAIHVRAARAERSIEIVVTDNGRGIPAHVRPRIFEPFFSTKAPGQGSGLGLFVSSEIVRALGGSIRVESVEGRGAAFHVLLPDADAGTDRVSGVIRAGRSGLVAVLDGDPGVWSVVRVASDRHVECYSDPDDVLRRIGAGISYDLIFCNAVVGNMSAVEFHGLLRKLPGDHWTRVVFLIDGIAPDYARVQRIALLRKPLGVGETRALIRARLGAESAAKPA